MKKETISIEMTWTGVLPLLLVLLEDGNAEGKTTAREELSKMARAADLYNKSVRKAA